MDDPNTEQPEKKGLRGLFSDTISGIGWLRDFIESSSVKMQNLTETNYNLAYDLMEQGRINDAIARFKITLWFSQNHVPSLYNLGCLYLHKGEDTQATDCFVKVLKLQPRHENALFMLSSYRPDMLKAEMRPSTIPRVIAEDYFDGLAYDYDFMQEAAGYRGHTLTHQLLSTEFDKYTKYRDLLDLGCGTGLCGGLFTDRISNIVGVDISNVMLDMAYNRIDKYGVKIFNKLLHQDMRDYLAETTQPFDVVLCINVLQHVGDLSGLFIAIDRVMKPGGFFALTFQSYPQAGNFGMIPAIQRFGHAPDYIAGLAQQAGFETVRTGEVMIYTEAGAELYIYKKPEAPVAENTPPLSGETPPQIPPGG